MVLSFECGFGQNMVLPAARNSTSYDFCVLSTSCFPPNLLKHVGCVCLEQRIKFFACLLPAAADRVVFCRLTPLQVSVYKAVLSHPDIENVLRVDEDCTCGSGQTRGKCCFKVSVCYTWMRSVSAALA